MPWAKAGLIIKASTRAGSPYAAIMVTSSHGVRMQDNYVHDQAGLPGPVSASSPCWPRAGASDDVVTGDDSAEWQRHRPTVELTGKRAGLLVPGGLFVGSGIRFDTWARA